MPYLRGRFYDGPPISDLDRMGKLSPGAVLAVLKHVLPWLEQEKPCPECCGRGIIMVAGGRYLKWAFASVSMARQHTDLPIQIWYLGKRELTQEDVERFEGLNVEFVDATSFLSTYRMFTFGGWEAKPYAVANCPFQEVLLLDADAYPVADPEDLFESPEFERTGCIMWPDLNICRKNNFIFPSMGLKHEPNFQEMEVGQLVIDKKRLWPGVRLTVWMNSHSEAFYQLLHGDKDQWQIAFRKMGIPFTVGDKPDWIGSGMVHKWKGRPVFNHVMNAKRTSEKPPREYMELLESYSQLQPA